MILTVACVTRNKAIYVTGLHMLLQLTAKCVHTGNQINIQFVQDSSQLPRLLKTSERVLWVDYGASLDVESFDKIFEKHGDILVFPAVKEGINWSRFSDVVKNGSTTEPLSQIGLDFDTVVDKKVEDGFYTVKGTVPSVFVMDCSKVYEKLREKKGEGLKLPHTIEDIFQKCVEKGVKIQAYTKCNVLRHYSHECVGNILEAVGVSCKRE